VRCLYPPRSAGYKDAPKKSPTIGYSRNSEIFESIRPATTLVQVARLIDDAALVEIEADAVVHPDENEVP
jgi:hypothetical protein